MPSIDEFLAIAERKAQDHTIEIAQLNGRIEELIRQRDEARAQAAVAHDAIRRLSDIVASDQSFTRLSKHIRGSIGSCLEAADPDAYEGLAEEIDIMYCALETIARCNDGEGQMVAQNTLERLSNE